MKKKAEAEINIFCDWPTANGRIYTKESIDNMAKSVEDKAVFVHMESPNGVQSLRSICGTVDKIRQDGPLIAETSIHDGLMDHLITMGLVEISPCGKGTVDPDGIVRNYELQSFSLVAKDVGDNPELDEETLIICETLNENSASILFKPFKKGMIFAEFQNRASNLAGLWIGYDPESQRLHIRPNDVGLDIYDPSLVDLLVNKLEEFLDK